MNILNQTNNVVSDVSLNTSKKITMEYLLKCFQDDNSICGTISNIEKLKLYLSIFDKIDINNLNDMLIHCHEKYFRNFLRKITSLNINIKVYKSNDFDYSRFYMFCYSKNRGNI